MRTCRSEAVTPRPRLEPIASPPLGGRGPIREIPISILHQDVKGTIVNWKAIRLLCGAVALLAANLCAAAEDEALALVAARTAHPGAEVAAC